ncbi:B-box zinc finger protein 32-like [Alnus glutinosa]|uniref:B-box zinc finger protein 32-like n=1 Tax=Alnus glutinosa TaxID=3517 RepID=UPI002D78BB51|nr:B-box zinc finger protein 32-like [Alnus glutinosa]
MKKAKVCELCSEEASLYCASDAAFLCFHCDARVHQANFLVAAHLRQSLCSKCNAFTGYRISDAGTSILLPQICHSCLPPYALSEDVDSLSSSSTCVSSTESHAAAPKRIALDDRRIREHVLKQSVSGSFTEISDMNENVPGPAMFSASAKMKVKGVSLSVDAKAEGIFMNWCRKLGVNGILVVPSAAKHLGFCLDWLAMLPFRVSMAVSLWLALRFCRDRLGSLSTCQNLRRLEKVSGVAARLILATEARVTSVVRAKRARRVLKEGWAECSTA